MVILIAGASHTGKTLLAQRLLEQTQFPSLSIDHLKMGLIRSSCTPLTPADDDRLTEYLWPIVREMVKTAIENEQNLIVEGCYIPCRWQQDFSPTYLSHLTGCFLVMSHRYIETHWADITAHANDIEHRLDDSPCTPAALLADNEALLTACLAAGCRYFLIDDHYPAPREIFPELF